MFIIAIALISIIFKLLIVVHFIPIQLSYYFLFIQ